MMKLALLSLTVSLLACVDSPDQPTVMQIDTHPWLAKCGTPPQIPQWSYTTTADSTAAIVPMEQWERHVDWSVAISAWSLCVDSTRF